MPMIQRVLFLLLLFRSDSITSQFTEFQIDPENPRPFSAREPSRSAANRLSRPLTGEDGKIYVCSGKNLYAFESNGTISWTINLGYTCHAGMAPVHGGRGKIYLVAENRVLKISFLDNATSPPATEVFFGPVPDQEGLLEIIGLSVSTMSSSVFINVKNRGLFAYMTRGQLLWSAGPMLDRFGYRLGCRKNVTGCYFTSAPMVDQCEASIYISNTEGELYCLSIRSPNLKWIQDFSSLDKSFTITPGNNGRLYVTVPAKALLLALDASSGTVLWQRSIGPLSTAECTPVVDSNVYLSQTEMEGKISRTIDEYTYVSAMRPKTVIFTLLVPAIGTIYWSESSPGQFSSLLSESDLRQFVLDEGILLAFFAASKIRSPLQCRSKYQKLASSCSQASPNHIVIYTGNERAIIWLLLFESAVLVILAGIVRFCCVFWRKKKLQGQNLGSFLEKRRSLQLKKKVFDRTITELKQKAAKEVVANEVAEKLGEMVLEREGIERKLSTTYSLGRDRAGSLSKSLLPLYDGKARSYSFQGVMKESVTVFHTLSDTTSGESSSEKETDSEFHDEESTAKAKAPMEAESSSDEGSFGRDYRRSPLEINASSSRGLPIHFQTMEQEAGEVKIMHDEEEIESTRSSGSKLRLTRRKALSPTN
ncbi:protein GAMETE EXPRESSED 3 isoform X2 [Juglans microcarpa x Juglans regia]|uniref:protein GAMETE EXPRESSED 3 isoform X2 n=1 Tax=Juglans microcarpa x Juglans regia TaxID=2249226 RepID=UPI001B7EA7F2|nr:protein GAMETE EXPRESSED 3 isoform X2 [Juglans microcarpa x Juglans regia]